MLKIALVNQKGGVGKTSTTVNTAAALATTHNRRVLVLDMDPQANATSALGIADNDIAFDTADVMASIEPGGAGDPRAAVPARRPEWDGIWVIPARLDLSKAEEDRTLGSEFRLRRALDTPVLADDYDVVLIDSPPSVGMLTTNALVAADHVLTVSEPTSPSVAGVVRLLDSISKVITYYNPALINAGALVNRMPNTREARQRFEELQNGLGSLDIDVWVDETVPLRAAITEALGAQAPPHALPGATMREAAGYYDAVAARMLRLDEERLEHGLRVVAGGEPAPVAVRA